VSSQFISSKNHLAGVISPPPDKSISHRAVMLASLAEGESRIHNFLEGEDCHATMRAFSQMGIRIERTAPGELLVCGKGLEGLTQPVKELYLANSGTTMRLLLGILAGQPFISTLAGDESLSKRPMKRVTEPLRKMGAKIQGPEDANFSPLTIRGGKLKGIQFSSEVASAQVKSAILLAGLFAKGLTQVKEFLPSRDHTERMLNFFGANFRKEGNVSIIQKTDRLNPQEISIPGDISSAAFFIVAACLVPDSEVMIKGVGLNPTRTGILEVLKEMGAEITIENAREDWEPVGDLRARTSGLKSVKLNKEKIPFLIDELPVLMVACALAQGKSEIRGAEELRVKESDRIRAMCENLGKLGVEVKELPDGCVIQGGGSFKGGKVSGFGDHRIAMSMAVAALKTPDGIEISGSDCVNISYPSFFKDLGGL